MLARITLCLMALLVATSCASLGGANQYRVVGALTTDMLEGVYSVEEVGEQAAELDGQRIRVYGFLRFPSELSRSEIPGSVPGLLVPLVGPLPSGATPVPPEQCRVRDSRNIRLQIDDLPASLFGTDEVFTERLVILEGVFTHRGYDNDAPETDRIVWRESRLRIPGISEAQRRLDRFRSSITGDNHAARMLHGPMEDVQLVALTDIACAPYF